MPRLTRRALLSTVGSLPLLPAASDRSLTRLANDPLRPQCHFLPAANWMNDPNGPIFYKGNYHLFYQYNPNGAFWGTMHWGHAVSKDLLHWRHLPIAFTPTPGGPDFDGVFSGSAVLYNGTPTMIYTGVKPEVQCLATSTDDDLVHWKKDPANPVIAGPPPGLKVTGFRDPCPWQEGDTWYCLVGSGFPKVGGAALLYKSADLRHWTYLHPFFTGQYDPKSTKTNPVATGEMWECPDFFPLGNKHVFLVSTLNKVLWFAGRYENQRFQPEKQGEIDPGAYYAPKSSLDGKGNRILWGWITEKRSVEAQKQAGWSGVMSLPRVLTLAADGTLQMNPLREVERLREKREKYSTQMLDPSSPARPPYVPTDPAELVLEIEPLGSEEVGLTLCAERGGLETRIAYQPKTGLFKVGEAAQTMRLPAGEPVRFRVFRDASVVEVFFNGRACITHRTYGQACAAVELFSVSAPARLKSFEAYRLKPISPDRLTT